MKKIILILLCLSTFMFGEEISVSLVEFKEDKIQVEIKSTNEKVKNYTAVITWNSGEVLILRNQGFSGYKSFKSTKTIPILPAEGIAEIKHKPTECVWVIFEQDPNDKQKLKYLKTLTFKKKN